MAEVIYHILLTFMKYGDADLDKLVERVLAAMKGNLNFATPDPALADIQTGLDAFTAAVAAKAQGGTKATKARDAAREALLALIRQLALYVEKESKNNPIVMLSSGFDITSASHTQTPLTTPIINSITNGPSGTALIHAVPQANVKSVLPQYRETGTTTWLNGPICTQMRNIPVPLLIPGKTYDFRLQFYGGSTGQSDWSDIVTHMVINDRPAGHRGVDVERDVAEIDFQADVPLVGPVRAEERRRETPRVLREVNDGDVPRLVQLFVNERHRADAVLALPEHLDVAEVPDVPRLEVEEARHDLEVVLHAVVDLLQQDLLLVERCAEPVARRFCSGSARRCSRRA